MFCRLSQFARFSTLAFLVGFTFQTQPANGLVSARQDRVSQPVLPVGTTSNSQGSGSIQESEFTSGNTQEITPTLPDTRVSGQAGSGYTIGSDDVLTVNVWHEPEVSRSVPVRPDGKISLPLIGDVQAAGLTPAELKKDLEVRFAKYLTNPAVSVIVSQIRSQRVNVLGQVYRPGTYPLIPPMSVIDAIATAGGLKEFARPNKIYVLRALPNGQQRRINFAYKDVLKGKAGSIDMELQTRDTVVVP